MPRLVHKEGNIIIYGEDSRVMCEVNDEYVDSIITSPPYNVKKKYIGKREYHDNLNDFEYFHMLYDIFKECYRVLKKEGVFFLNVGFNREDLKKAWKVLEVAEQAGFIYFQPIIWMKSFMGKGHYSPSKNPKHFYLNYEYIFILVKDEKFKLNAKKIGIPYTDKSNLKRYNHSVDLRDAGNVWFIPYETRNKDSRILYPSIYPFKLVQNCIDVLDKDNGIILDPFCGVGTSLIVAEDNGFDAIGYDVTFNIEGFKQRKKGYEKWKNNEKNDER